MLLTSFFFARFTGPPPSKCTLTPARSFAELSRNFRENIPIHRPRPSAESASKENQIPNTRGLRVWLSHSLTFGNLAPACGACFSVKSIIRRSDSGRCKDALQDHGGWPWRSLTFGSSAATYEGQKAPHRELNQNQTEILQYPSPAGPRAAEGGSPLQDIYR